MNGYVENVKEIEKGNRTSIFSAKNGPKILQTRLKVNDLIYSANDWHKINIDVLNFYSSPKSNRRQVSGRCFRRFAPFVLCLSEYAKIRDWYFFDTPREFPIN